MTAVPTYFGLPAAPSIDLLDLPRISELTDPRSYLERNSRSFGFASAFLDRSERMRVARLYAWCRYVDDLVDRPADEKPLVSMWLDRWTEASREAYAGRPTGVRLIDDVMTDMTERGIPFRYAAEVIAGVRSDLEFRPYRDLAELRVYTFRVAGVVGCWLTELHGVNDPWMLERAASLGHAMQLTNILRDVGEDSWNCRLYIPLAVLRRHRLSPADVEKIRRRERPIDDSWREMVEELASVAARDYSLAGEAIPYLPAGFRRSVAVAAAIYEDIITAIRRNGYDNVNRRAFTTRSRKILLAASTMIPSLARPVERRAS